MDHSLEGLAKERGARYSKFDFAGATRVKNGPSKKTSASQPEVTHQGIREDSRPWKEPVKRDREVSPVAVSPIPTEVKPQVVAAPSGFSFFAGSLFLCLTLMVLHTLPENAFVVLKTSGHIGVDRVDVAAYRIPEVTLPLIVFGIASVLACGYFLSWIACIYMRICRRVFRRRQNED